MCNYFCLTTYLAIRDDGDYSLGLQSQGQTIPKVDWTPSNTIHSKGQANRLELVSNGDQISGLINGVRVGSFRDEQFQSGGVGVFSENAGKAGSNLRRDTLWGRGCGV